MSAITETMYFFKENLVPGFKMNLPRLSRRSDLTKFLPQQIAESIPMSRKKLPEILKKFSLNAESREAEFVESAIRSCERGEMSGEEKYCVRSFESFIDSSVSMLAGKNIRLLSHQIGKPPPTNSWFTIGQKRDLGDKKNIVCHKMIYPYAVYLCHSIRNTTVYQVPVVNMQDGTKANGVAVCHEDTSGWDPNHVSFRYLKIKPGTVPICHFVNRDTLVWVPN